MIDRLSGRLAVVLIAAALLLVVLVGWFALVSPQRSKAATLESQIESTNVQISSTQAYLRSPAARGAKKQLARLAQADPPDVRMSQILRQLSAIAGSAGVSLDSITPGAAVASAGGQAVPISLSVEGHYFGLAKFLHLLRASAEVKGKTLTGKGRLYSVDSIQFSSGANGAPISASVALNAFVSTPAPAAPTTTTSTETTTTP